MARQIALIAAMVGILSFVPTRLSAQQNYVGLTLCSSELQSAHPDFSVLLDRAQRAYVVYRPMPKTRLVMLVVFRVDDSRCGTVRDVREYDYSPDVFVEECIEALDPGNVVVGFFDQKFDEDHPERGALMRGPAVKSWSIDLKKLKFSATSGKVTCVMPDRADYDDGSDLAIRAHRRATKTQSQPAK